MKRTAFFSVAPLALALFVSGCGGEPAKPPQTPIPAPPPPAPVQPPATSTGPDLSQIPAPGQPKPLKPAQITRFQTKGGIDTLAIVSHELPIVHCRVVIKAGNAASVLASTPGKSRAGIANMVAELMKDGGAGRFAPREIADRVDAIGSDLGVEVAPDRTVFSLAVTKDKLDAALEVLGAVVTKPHFDAGEFGKLKARELDRVRQSEKGSGSWIARTALYRDMFGAGHPYADIDATDVTLGNIDLADVRGFYKKVYTAPNVLVVIAGDIEPDDAKAKIEKHLGGLSTAQPATVTIQEAKSQPTHVVLASKPGSKQADILIGSLSLARKDPKWPDLALAVQALGGGMSARLFVDVREKRSLAYSTGSTTRELAHGPSVVALFAGTQTPLAAKSVAALIEHLDGVSGAHPIEEPELAIARTSLETGFLFRLETIGAVAGLAIDQEIFGYPGKDVYDYVAGYRAALLGAPLDKVRAIATERLTAKGVVIAVAGDPGLAKALSHFGAVRVVDPEKDFATTEQLAQDPNASLDVTVAK